MFGRMTVTPILHVGADTDLQTAITLLSQAAEQAEIVRWIEFRNSVLLFLVVPGDPESGAFYILDRKTGTWYSVDFDDKQYGGYSTSQLEELLKECDLLDLVERPSLWRTGLNWWVDSGKAARTARLTGKAFGLSTYTNLDSQSDCRWLCSCPLAGREVVPWRRL